jgi:hypothetical protein
MSFKKFLIVGILIMAALLAVELFAFLVLDNLTVGTLFTGVALGWGAALVFTLKIDGNSWRIQ